MSEDGTQQGDTEAPPLFAETIHTQVKQLESKINIWYLDDGNLADDYKVVLRKIFWNRNKFTAWAWTLRSANFVLAPFISTQYSSILTQFQKIGRK